MRYLWIFLLCTQFAWAQSTPQTTVSKFYNWLTRAGMQSSKRLAEVQDCFTPELYSLITRAYAKDPSDGNFLDFDPWSNTQMGATGYTWKPGKVTAERARFAITVRIEGGGTGRYACVLVPKNGQWLIHNLEYPEGHNLLQVLKEIVKP